VSRPPYQQPNKQPAKSSLFESLMAQAEAKRTERKRLKAENTTPDPYLERYIGVEPTEKKGITTSPTRDINRLPVPIRPIKDNPGPIRPPRPADPLDYGADPFPTPIPGRPPKFTIPNPILPNPGLGPQDWVYPNPKKPPETQEDITIDQAKEQIERYAGDIATKEGAEAGNQARQDLTEEIEKRNTEKQPVQSKYDQLSQQYDAEVFNKEKGIAGSYAFDYIGQSPLEKGGDEAAYMKGMKDNWVKSQLGDHYDKEIFNKEKGVSSQYALDYVGQGPMEKGGDEAAYMKGMKDNWVERQMLGGQYDAEVFNKEKGIASQYAHDYVGQSPLEKGGDEAAYMKDMKDSWIDRQQLSKKYDEEIFNKEKGIAGRHAHDYISASPMEKGGDEAAYMKGMKDDWISKQTGYSAGVKNKTKEVKDNANAKKFAKDKATQVQERYQNPGLQYNKEAKEWQHRGTGKTATGKERADQVGHYGAYTEEGRKGIGYKGMDPNKGTNTYEKGSDAYYGAEFSQSHGRGSKWTEHQKTKDPTLDNEGLKRKYIEQRRAFDANERYDQEPEADTTQTTDPKKFAKDKAAQVTTK